MVVDSMNNEFDNEVSTTGLAVRLHIDSEDRLPGRKSKCRYSPTEVLPWISLTPLAQLVTTITIRTTTIITIITSDNRI